MRYSPFLILSVFLFIATLSANVMAMSGLELLKYCKSDDTAGRTFCKGYIVGILEAGLFVSLKHDYEAVPFCTPLDGMKPPQAQMIVVKYLEDHPEKLHFESVILAVDALSDAFPCSTSQK